MQNVRSATEHDILYIFRALARRRFCRGLHFTGTREVFPYLQTLLADYAHEVFTTAFQDSQHRLIIYRKLFTETINRLKFLPQQHNNRTALHK